MSTPAEIEQRVNAIQYSAHILNIPVSLAVEVETLLAFEAMNLKLDKLIEITSKPPLMVIPAGMQPMDLTPGSIIPIEKAPKK